MLVWPGRIILSHRKVSLTPGSCLPLVRVSQREQRRREQNRCEVRRHSDRWPCIHPALRTTTQPAQCSVHPNQSVRFPSRRSMAEAYRISASFFGVSHAAARQAPRSRCLDSALASSCAFLGPHQSGLQAVATHSSSSGRRQQGALNGMCTKGCAAGLILPKKVPVKKVVALSAIVALGGIRARLRHHPPTSWPHYGKLRMGLVFLSLGTNQQPHKPPGRLSCRLNAWLPEALADGLARSNRQTSTCHSAVGMRTRSDTI